MIKVIDNVLPAGLADQIEKDVTSDSFSWYLLRDINKESLKIPRVVIDKNTVNTVQLGHGVFDIRKEFGKQINSSYFGYSNTCLNFIIKKLGWKDADLLRIKYNLLFNNSQFKTSSYNTPHVDNEEKNSYAIIYYVNDSDGDTILFNERFDYEKNIVPKKLTINQKISPKKNRVLIFDGDIFHTSSNPILSEKRIVMNINVKKYE